MNRLIIRILLSITLLMQSVSAQAELLTLAVASNFTAAMNEIVEQFEAGTEHSVRVSYGSSGMIYAQIINGAPFDIFFSADQEKPQALEDAGMILPSTRFTYAVGGLALWSKNAELDLQNGEILRHGNFNRLALANPRLAPYGIAAVETLQHLGLDESTRHKWVLGENISQALQFVETRNADLGFVSVSQILDQGEVRDGSAWLVPADLHSPIRQDAVILRRAEQNPAAHAFINFIQGNQASSIIESFGYRLDSE
ncbi:MAG: molybdate ABC transporter substrate-binding protein [Gammaproteobacteria bacterium]|nr:molybdate ABC transporter substrate-binding protein [Gammaproteobacteria bacterium]